MTVTFLSFYGLSIFLYICGIDNNKWYKILSLITFLIATFSGAIAAGLA